jgi:hypothetical protein
MKRLTIIVPYRDRESHLRQFVPHVRAYFARDKADREIPYSVIVVEQEPGLPFNLGALRNIGFLLAGDSDYVCFHDVDYLPMWADYSWCDVPTSIVWYGAEGRPIRPANPAAGRVHSARSLESFFGGVLLVPKDLLRQVNGFSNDYWGWGREDTDLKRRFAAANINTGRRKGTFMPLDHDHRGYRPGHVPTKGTVINRTLFDEKWASGKTQDGISTVDYEILRRRAIPDPPNPERAAAWEMVTVRLNMKPRADQMAAYRQEG